MTVEQLDGLLQVVETFGMVGLLLWVVSKNDNVIKFYREKLEKWETLLIDDWKQKSINLRDTEVTRRNPKMQSNP